MINYLTNDQIDKKLWDEKLLSSRNPKIYALSRYMDIVFPEWSALVYGDYQAFMPVFPKKKLGIHYLHQPIYIQQSGVYFQQNTEFYRTEDFFNAIPVYFKWIDLHLNTKNLPPKGIKLFKEKKINQTLELKDNYSTLYQRFSESHKKNIRRSQKYGLKLTESNDVDFFIQFKKQHPSKYRESLSVLNRLANGFGEKFLRIFSVIDEKNHVFSVALFFFWNQTLTWLSSGASPETRENKALFFLVDSLIQKYAESNIILDFAGSSLPGVWYFNNGFGAKDEIYYHLKINRLPLIIKWLK